MDPISLTDRNGKQINNAEYTDVRDAYLEVFRAKGWGRSNFISIYHVGLETEIEVYLQTVVINDYIKFYDGPGGPSELASIRVKEGEILPRLQEILNSFQDGDVDRVIEILNSLPKPEANN